MSIKVPIPNLFPVPIVKTLPSQIYVWLIDSDSIPVCAHWCFLIQTAQSQILQQQKKNNKVLWVSYRCTPGSLCLLSIHNIVCTFTKAKIWVNSKPTTLVFLCLSPFFPYHIFFLTQGFCIWPWIVKNSCVDQVGLELETVLLPLLPQKLLKILGGPPWKLGKSHLLWGFLNLLIK